MNASIAVQVLPKVMEQEETRRIVDQVIAYLASTGLPCEVGPFETVLEGDLDQLLDLVKECCRICVRAGAPSVMSYVKISYKPDGVWSMADKTGKYRTGADRKEALL